MESSAGILAKEALNSSIAGKSFQGSFVFPLPGGAFGLRKSERFCGFLRARELKIGINGMKVRLLPFVELLWSRLHAWIVVPSIFEQHWLGKLRCQNSQRLVLGSCYCDNCTGGLIPGSKEIEMKWQMSVCPARKSCFPWNQGSEGGVAGRFVSSVLRKGSSALGLDTQIFSDTAEEISDLSPFINFTLFMLCLLSWNRAHCFKGVLGAGGDAWFNFRSDRAESAGGTIASLQKWPKTMSYPCWNHASASFSCY